MSKISMVLLLAVCAAAMADVKLPAIFSDNMVLQQGMEITVWGTAVAGEKVKVVFNGQEAETVSSEDGKWLLKLKPMGVGGPLEMTVSGNNNMIIKNIFIGEVWLCSGQSNMAWRLGGKIKDREKHLAAANHPRIRFFNVERNWKTAAGDYVSGKWEECTTQTAENCTAVGYFFGLELFEALKVPVGLVNASWGGSRIEPWTPPAGFKEVAQVKNIDDQVEAKDVNSPVHKEKVAGMLAAYKKWLAGAEKQATAGEMPDPAPNYPVELRPWDKWQDPTAIYNAMLYGLTPYVFRGAIWYQGESNHSDRMMYYYKQQALVKGWRKVWNNPEMPFYLVQLAPYSYGNSHGVLPWLWQAQEQFVRDTPNTGMAVINDVGNVKDVHPADKETVGNRLAWQALRKTYGKTEIVADSPTLKSMEIDENKVLLTFQTKSLKTRDGKTPDWFEIAGPDGVFVKAEAEISNNTVTLTAAGVNSPCFVQFAWDGWAEPNLTGETGLPVGAFKAAQMQWDERVPELKNFVPAYIFDPTNPKMSDGGKKMTYAIDYSPDFAGKKIKRVAYYLALTPNEGEAQYVFAAMDTFSPNVRELGVPAFDVGKRFQQNVKNLVVKSNVPGVENGTFAEGNIEFWECNYGKENRTKVPGASEQAYDFGDTVASDRRDVGYGSMQVHNFEKKQTVFSFNNFRSGKNADVGIGNQPKGEPDWTFSGSAKNYKNGVMIIAVETE